MKLDSRRLYQTFCLTALIVGMGYPAWAQLQQTRAYYGYSDIRLSQLGTPGPGIAGSNITLPVQIFNRGPDRADTPRVVFSVDSNQLTGVSTLGCTQSPSASSGCLLTALGLNVGKDVAQTWRIHPSARGTLVIGAFGLSEATDPVPGNEQVISVTSIGTSVNLQANVISAVPQTLADGRLRWAFQVRNFGISDVLATTASTSGTQSQSLICSASVGNAHCGANISSSFLGVNGELRYDVITPSLTTAPNQAMSFTVSANAENETNPKDNSVLVTWSDALLRNGFE